MRILVTGSNGQIGWELQRTLCPLGDVIAVDRRRMDLAFPDVIRATIRDMKPAIIVNGAAYTAVDKAESEPALATAINGTAPGIMAEEARRLGCFVIHYSTDYVFDGTKQVPYDESDSPNPLNAYGRSKLAGEQAIGSVSWPHYIFRTSWVYSDRRHNFFRTIIRMAKEHDELRIVDDQWGAPTWARAIAESTAMVVAQAVTPNGLDVDRLHATSGLYHLTAAGSVSWFGFAEAILRDAETVIGGPAPKLTPIPTSAYPLSARRPPNSRLDNSKFAAAFGLKLPDWKAMLYLCCQDMGRPA